MHIATGAASPLAADFIDRSSVEIFINDGEGVMSSRYFPGYPGQLTAVRRRTHSATGRCGHAW
jgi:sucrose-6-phosphate hydrolase SacC (GH32 family)